jgi:lactoylglutathione lyase
MSVVRGGRALEIVKAAVDIGLFTEVLDEELAFWTAMGLACEPQLKLGGGVHQHRFRAGSSVLKVNHSLQPLAAEGSGIREVTVISPAIKHPALLVSPGRACVRVAKPTGCTSPTLTVHLEVADLAAHGRFWGDILELQRDGPHGFRWGSSVIELREVSQSRRPATWRTLGWSYLTLQVRDCAAAHQEALQRGAWEGEPPRRMGDAAVISFVRDPDGNFVELSQRADIVGALPSEPAHVGAPLRG